MKKGLNQVRKSADPVNEQIDDLYFGYIKKRGFFVDKSSYHRVISNTYTMAYTAPGKKSFLDGEPNELIPVGYLMVSSLEKKKGLDGFFIAKIMKTDSLEQVNEASLFTEENEAVGTIDVEVSFLDGYDEDTDQARCEDHHGSMSEAYYVDFEYYCIKLYPDINEN